MKAVIAFAHGSRDPQWRAPIEAITAHIQAQDPSCLTRTAYLELCEPSLPTAARELVEAGVTEVRILPVFFGMGKHAREDLPELVHELQTGYPYVKWQCLPTAGENPELLKLLASMALKDPA
jgi:sirohydrochlorin cobaltochelatase